MSPTVHELEPGRTGLAFTAMRELRTHLTSRAEFEQLVDQVLRPEGYRLVATFDGADTDTDAVAVAGFRTEHLLARGRSLYVDDLVTREDRRRRGHADALFRWLVDEARRQRCDQLHLDSGVQRHDAHRFYLAHGMHIAAHHFAMRL